VSLRLQKWLNVLFTGDYFATLRHCSTLTSSDVLHIQRTFSHHNGQMTNYHIRQLAFCSKEREQETERRQVDREKYEAEFPLLL